MPGYFFRFVSCMSPFQDLSRFIWSCFCTRALPGLCGRSPCSIRLGSGTSTPEGGRVPADRVPQGGKCNPCSLHQWNSFFGLSCGVVRCRRFYENSKYGKDSFALNTLGLTCNARTHCDSGENESPVMHRGLDCAHTRFRQIFERG